MLWAGVRDQQTVRGLIKQIDVALQFGAWESTIA